MGAYLEVILTEGTPSVSGNTSPVTTTVKIHSNYGTHDYNANATLTTNVDQTEHYHTEHAPSWGNANYGSSAWVTTTLATYTDTIDHDDDGSKYLTVGVGLPTPTSAGNLEKVVHKTLTTIARASQPTLNDSTVWMRDQAVTIYTNRKSTSFTHTLTYSFGGASGTIGTGIGTSKTWTPPISLASQIPNATSGSGTITCKTYNGGTLVGTKSISISLYVPNNILPSIDSVSNTETVAGLVSKFGGYVQGKSKIKAAMSVSGIYGSTIKSSSIKIDGTSYSGLNVTSDFIQNGGTIPIVYTVTDTRNRSIETTINVSIFGYSNPSPASLNTYRCDEVGNPNAEGSYAKVEVSASISPVGDNNDIAYRVKYKKTSESTYTTVNLTSTAYSIDTSVILREIDVNSRYNIVLEVQDYFMLATREVVLATAFTLMDFSADGTGIGIGKVSENSNELDINLPVRFRGSIIGLGLLDIAYPVGAIYLSVSSTNPTDLIGGTWEQIKDKFLLSAGDSHTAGSTGGAETHNHTVNSHRHLGGYHTHTVNSHSHGAGTYTARIYAGSTIGYMDTRATGNWSADRKFSSIGGYNSTYSYLTTGAIVQGTSSATTGKTGSSHAYTDYQSPGTNAGSNMPPYLAVYMWKRVA